MKKLITTCILLFSLIAGAQTPMGIGMNGEFSDDEETVSQNAPLENNFRSETFEQIAEKEKIPFRTVENIDDAEEGYYAITGVFGSKKNLKKVVKKLKKKGFDAGSIYIPEKNLNYVYIQYFPFGLEAIEAYKSSFDGKYNEDSWILQLNTSNVQNENIAQTDGLDDDSVEETITEEDADIDLVNEEIQDLKINNSKKSGATSKLLKKANAYFDKMWYAESAELYEKALAKGEQHYTFDVIQKAADAHYYNTNMEKAHHWYDILYSKYGKEMSADNVFKYAHSLKGTGKYAHSKRLMRLYNKKIKNGEYTVSSNQEPNRNEIVLDEILSSKQDFELKNLSINTEYSDFSPMFLDSNQMVFASAKDSSFLNTRRYKWNDQPFLDLYVAKINEESQDLKNAIKFSKNINTKYHEASVTFSPDNSTMYFTRNNFGKKLGRDKNGVNHLKLYTANKINGEWTEAVEVPFNSNDYSTGHPALSPDGKKLYFVSDMPGTIGETDIFVVDVLGDNLFSDPKNLGPEINTEQKEMFPFINDEKLYFSSNGHIGLGGLDVFEVAYTEEGFEEVRNVGMPINSSKDDFSYIVNEENQKGYFASNRAKGKGDDDIYAFTRLVIEEVPANKSAIAGVVTEMVTGEIMPNALIELLDENGIKLKEMVADDDGNFVFEDLEADKSYTVKATKDEYKESTNTVTSIENDTIQADLAINRLVELVAIEEGIRKLKINNILFNFDKFNIRSDASEELDKLVDIMNEYPDMIIKIESHTDSRGNKAYNKYLSDKRAKSSRDYLISKGIAEGRIASAIGYGEERLLNECDGSVKCAEKMHLLNRRSEFIIVDM